MPHAVDEYVGRRIRSRRIALELTQSAFGLAAGISYQQVQKYERGITRVSASRLYRIAAVLGVTIDWFFEGYDAANYHDRPQIRPVGFYETAQGRVLFALWPNVPKAIRPRIIHLMEKLVENRPVTSR